jgi:hypothetical protein
MCFEPESPCVSVSSTSTSVPITRHMLVPLDTGVLVQNVASSQNSLKLSQNMSWTCTEKR